MSYLSFQHRYPLLHKLMVCVFYTPECELFQKFSSDYYRVVPQQHLCFLTASITYKWLIFSCHSREKMRGRITGLPLSRSCRGLPKAKTKRFSEKKEEKVTAVEEDAISLFILLPHIACSSYYALPSHMITLKLTSITFKTIEDFQSRY